MQSARSIVGLVKQLIERNTDMVASARKGTRRATQSSRESPPMGTDVIDLLSEDHRKVEELFEEYESLKDEADDDAKAQLVATSASSSRSTRPSRRDILSRRA
jgi:hypothetical protein